jgi:DNA-binding PadR family transcriptional regulator
MFADGEWRTAYEVARAQGKQTSDVFGLIRRMHGDGLLEPDSEPTRGTQYRLTPAGRAALEEALGQKHAIGTLAERQWALVVERGLGSLSNFEGVVTNIQLSGAIVWSASLGWGWLLALSPASGEFQAKRLVTAFESAGFRCRESCLQGLLSGAQMREQASTLVDEIKATR